MVDMETTFIPLRCVQHVTGHYQQGGTAYVFSNDTPGQIVANGTPPPLSEPNPTQPTKCQPPPPSTTTEYDQASTISPWIWEQLDVDVACAPNVRLP